MSEQIEPNRPTEETQAVSGEAPGQVRYRLHLKRGRERSVLLRHPWIFTGSVAQVEALEGAVPGDVGDVVDADGAFLARCTVQPQSQIVGRVLTWKQEEVNRALFQERFAQARDLRTSVVDQDACTAWREVNAEGDGVPGLVIDRYGDVIVVQTLTAGMFRLRPFWLEALISVYHPRSVLERGERARREAMEAPSSSQRLLWGDPPPVPLEIREHGLRFLVDLEGGQKTGFYLDQRENRSSFGRLARETRVLNLFGYTGAFSVYAGAGGAQRVVHVETSETARQFARENWNGNHLDPEKLEIVDEDVFRFLRQETRNFDRIVIDPPPFAKDKGSVERALRAYKDLHLWAFCLGARGALIWSFTCSQHVSADLFQKVVFGAARDVGASVQWLGRLGAGADHPVHLDHPQGEYLNGLWMRLLQPGTPPAPRRDRA